MDAKNSENLTRIVLIGLTAWFIFMLTARPTEASEIRYLIRDKVFCSSNEEICIRGTLSYEVNPHLLRLRGRVVNTAEAGLLRIILTGTNPLGHRRATEMELSLRGKHSEIINHKMIPDYPDVDSWEVVSISYKQ